MTGDEIDLIDASKCNLHYRGTITDIGQLLFIVHTSHSVIFFYLTTVVAAIRACDKALRNVAAPPF